MKTSFNICTMWMLLILATSLHAQQTKISPITLALNKELRTQRNPDAMLPVLIQGEPNAIQQFLQSKQLKIKFVSGDIISAELNTATINELRNLPFVSLIDCPKSKLHLLNDVMVIQNNVDSAYNGTWPLDQSYDGSGVVIGIIDAPFDFDHPDFTDAFGNTRIKYLWDQTVSDVFPAPDDYGYGIECDSTSIADGTCPHIDYNYWYSHGSGVTGVAASSGNAANKFHGVAPNADLILVALDFNDDYFSRTVDAIAYIYQKAAELGKPCVINTSFGSYDGSHDGKDLTTKAINNLITETPGRALVAAAGNGGNAQIHLGYTVSDTAHFTWFKKLSYTNAIYFQAFADTADFNNVYFSIGADNPTGWIFRGASPDYNVMNDYNLPDGNIDSTNYDLYDGVTFIGNIKTYIQSLNGTYFLEVVIVPAYTNYYWRFTTHGNGKFDIYSTETYTGYSNYVITDLPADIMLPDIIHYKFPDFTQNIVGYWQCSNKVISVGSYVNRDTMTNYYGENITLPYFANDLAATSSFGPTRDNRIKPDITATGSMVLTTGSTVLTDWLISLGAANNISPDGMHYLQNGTSFASPVVTGIAALYFQKNPNANWQEVKNAILKNATQDEFTGDELPNNAWGYGKANAFRTLTGSWGCEAENYSDAPVNVEVDNITSTSAQLHWDLIPNVSGYQVKIKEYSTGNIYKNTLTSHIINLNFLSPGNGYQCQVRAFCEEFGVSEWSSVLLFSTPTFRHAVADIKVFPNPANAYFTLENLPQGNLDLQMYDALGKCIFITSKMIENSDFTFSIENIPSGFYILVIQINNQQFKKSIVINH
ncbi:MAG: S8 family serine peptidase [Chitinophagales bacterium]|nr:S8 family serine peptidase [Chitinophagales bacterium]